MPETGTYKFQDIEFYLNHSRGRWETTCYYNGKYKTKQYDEADVKRYIEDGSWVRIYN